MTENRLVIKRVPMRRTASIDSETGEMIPTQIVSVEIECNGKIYGAVLAIEDSELHQDFGEAHYRMAAVIAWRNMAHQLLVEAGGPNLDDPDWNEDRTWIEGVADD